MKMKKVQVNMNGSDITISRICDINGTEYSVTLLPWQYNMWVNGNKVTEFAPNLSADEREFLITGTTPAEWDDMFPEPLEQQS